MQDYTIQAEALPASIRELAEAIGHGDALRFIGQHGGARVRVPKTVDEDSPLRAGMSPAGYERLVRYYSGGSFDVPKGDAYLRALRHEQVRQARTRGLTVDAIAEETGYTRRHVINILCGHGGRVPDTFTMTLPGIEPPAVTAPTPRAIARAGGAHDPFGLGGRRG